MKIEKDKLNEAFINVITKIKYNKQAEIDFERYMDNPSPINKLKLFEYIENTEISKQYFLNNENYDDTDKEIHLDVFIFIICLLTKILPNDIDSEERKKFNITNAEKIITILKIKSFEYKDKDSAKDRFNKKIIDLCDCNSSNEAMEYINLNLKRHIIENKIPFNAVNLFETIIDFDNKDKPTKSMRNWIHEYFSKSTNKEEK